MSHKTISSLVAVFGLLVSPWTLAAIKEYHLNINEQQVNVTGKPLKRITVNGKFTAPLLEFEEGDEAVIHVHNQLKNQDTSLHWHGLLLPGLMDGVPGFNNFKGIAPNGDFVYRFKVKQNGTYWYHAHSKGQEQDGLYGPLVIYPKGKIPVAAHEKTDRDYVVMLSDFHDSSSDSIMKNLKKSAEYYQNRRETVSDVLKQVKTQGLKATWQDRSMWNQMRMLKTDMSDVTGYTFLVNGKTPQQNWTGNFKAGDKVRLRFINASAMSFFDVRIPNLKMTVVSADGQPVKPVAIDEFRIGTAETYDVIVEPKQPNYQIEAESIDRSGFAIGTLHNENTQAVGPVQMPTPRPRALLTMDDMGMSHGGGSNEHAGHQMNMQHDMSAMPEMKKETSQANHDHTMMKMDHDMKNMLSGEHDHSMMHMKHDMSAMSEMNHDMQAMSSSEHEHAMMNMNHEMPAQSENKPKKDEPVYGWANASTPAGMKALQYSDLQSLTPQPDTRAPERELVIRLGGNMERYIWTINGKKFSDTTPLQVKYGERIRLKFVNDSMMAHPMHLHGMFMQLENGQQAENLPNKHTLIVPPGKTVTALLTADALGEWAIHCHLLYHMSAGMMNKLIVAQVNDGQQPAQSQPTVQSENEKGASHAHH
ncbi:copper resistance system multicopper oxidase [Acinetobacter baumannii]|uniref:copper resistance system multicopper oxidase n=1 Tax=Acinetobacter calcoaceticus/baumannii complex TaxID=909768 RepID=UPI00027894C8|nr:MULTISPECIES: copper resistance system multicopper oxidase [Acinetobacter calcoaceticus/baumannii complex]AVI33331.1 copper-resistance, CopA family protein [Acinetobacter baumannii]AVI38270.1 copper-resistance, CopA family protein [Acinetobacter baumannii]EHU1235757.1 copper resistance system multicopper oxidase [Acinetobacter baumannii]EHU1448254.1 copper resistance system multicopper oxidase [Acinetobacter baumannii]EHU1570621.1 copper resistance system multicopper oxidase [Acinetobacter 